MSNSTQDPGGFSWRPSRPTISTSGSAIIASDALAMRCKAIMNQKRDPKQTLSSLNSLVKLYREDAKKQSENGQVAVLGDGADPDQAAEARPPMTAFEYRSNCGAEKARDSDITMEDFRAGIKASLAAAKRAPVREYIEGLESLVGVGGHVSLARNIRHLIRPDALNRILELLRKN